MFFFLSFFFLFSMIISWLRISFNILHELYLKGWLKDQDVNIIIIKPDGPYRTETEPLFLSFWIDYSFPLCVGMHV
jgi:hypothetical protein